MKVKALKDLNQTIKAGAVLELPKDKAMPIIEAGLITPLERVAYRIYSNILQAYLWVVQDDAEAAELMAEGITEPIYTGKEIMKLKTSGMDKQGLQAVHAVKQVFENSKVKDETTDKRH